MLIFIRHGQAEMQATSDRERHLTTVGELQVVESSCVVDDYLSHLQSNQQVVIYHSPFVRTTETASILHHKLTANTRLEVNEHLLSNASIAHTANWLESLEDQLAILVTHQPLVSELIALMVSGELGNTYAFPMSTASVAVLDGEVIARGLMRLESLQHASGSE